MEYHNKKLISFSDGIAKIRLNLEGLRVEAIRTDGTFNYLINLNFSGQTWAAVLRIPSIGANYNEFIEDKLKALRVVDYLKNHIKDGIKIAENIYLKFDGISQLVDGKSTQNFLVKQSNQTPLKILNEIDNKEDLITSYLYPDNLPKDVKEYVSNYQGLFYLSRGAPAWETLEEYTFLFDNVAKSIAKLQKLTGDGTFAPISIAQKILSSIQKNFLYNADEWIPIKNTKEFNAFNKKLAKWSISNDQSNFKYIKRESYLRTSLGKILYNKLFEKELMKNVSLDNHYKCFCHGDCHGGNFIIVKYEYTTLPTNTILNREYINDIFTKHKNLESLGINIDGGINISKSRKSSIIANKYKHYEIHPIDLDQGFGLDRDRKQSHLFDLIFYAISINNLSNIFNLSIKSNDVLEAYYSAL